MRSRSEALGPGASRHRALVGRLRRAILLLAATACTDAALLHSCQQTNQSEHRPMHNLHAEVKPQWTWLCRINRCERIPASQSAKLQSLPTCNMLCASMQLWPRPTGLVRLAIAAVPVLVEGFSLQIVSSPSREVTEHLNDAFALVKNDLLVLERSGGEGRRTVHIETPRHVLVRVSVNGSSDVRMRLDTDESYKLSHQPAGNTLVVDISAHSFCGIRHGFETLSQLIWFDPYIASLLVLEAASIEDAPKFKYRGLLLDTARNFFPLPDILRTIDAMAACKLNTFHWHASDSQSFPLKLNSVPQLAQHGAYGPKAIYTVEDIKTVVRRARLRGIRVLIEVDAPAHVGRAWSWGPTAGLGHLAFCVEAQPWKTFCVAPPCGQLNPKNLYVYDLLERIYAEVIQLTGVDDLFHLGGDEVRKSCWSEHIPEEDPMELWIEFTHLAIHALERANGGTLPELILLWSSPLTQSPYSKRLDNRTFGIQIWGSSSAPESLAVLNTGFRSVLSPIDKWYLDCGFGSWFDSRDGHCRYRSWQQMYEHRPWMDEKPGGVKPWRVEGGAACQWTEQLDPGGLDARVWPRTAAFAERLWSDRSEGAVRDVYSRLDMQRTRLLNKGVRAAPLWPQWCSHNPQACL